MATDSSTPFEQGLSFEDALRDAGRLREIPNYERGCNYLDRNDDNSAYIRSDVEVFSSAEGTIPRFVEFDEPIPYRESHFRAHKEINGTEFLLEATQYVGENPEGETQEAMQRVLTDSAPVMELPEDEILSYLERAQDNDLPDFGGTPFLGTMNSHDLLMWVGKTYYPTPADFIHEARAQGVNKKISLGKEGRPPVIRPFRTRLFVIHPHAIPTGKTETGEDLDLGDPEVDWLDQAFVPGIVGYTYLTRAVHTGFADGSHPEWTKDLEERGLLYRVDYGEEIPKSDPRHPQHETQDRSLSVVEERRKQFEKSDLKYQDYRSLCTEHDIHVEGSNPSTDDLLNSLARSSVPVPGPGTAATTGVDADADADGDADADAE